MLTILGRRMRVALAIVSIFMFVLVAVAPMLGGLLGFLGGASGRENQSAEGLPSSAPPNSVNGSVVATVPVGNGPISVAYDGGNGYVYVANSGSNTVSVINGTTLVATIPAGGETDGVAYDSRNGFVYVANHFAPMSVINGTTVVATISLGSFPRGVAYDSGNGYIYVTNEGSGTVSVVNGTTVVATVSVGSGPWAVAYNNGNGYVYVANYASGSVSVINGTSVFATVPVGNEPIGVGYDSGNGYVYVSNGYVYSPNPTSNTMSVINGTTVVATITVPVPAGVAYDSGNGYVYVASYGSNTTKVISGTTVVASVPVGIKPYGIAYDSGNGYVYVSNLGSATVSVISTTTTTAPLDYSLSNNGPVSIRTGSSGTANITATLKSGTSQSITLSCATPLPTGVACASFSPSSVTPTQSSDLVIAVAPGTPAGVVTVKVIGTPLGITTVPTSVTVMITAQRLPGVVAGNNSTYVFTKAFWQTNNATEFPNPFAQPCTVITSTLGCANIARYVALRVDNVSGSNVTFSSIFYLVNGTFFTSEVVNVDVQTQNFCFTFPGSPRSCILEQTSPQPFIAAGLTAPDAVGANPSITLNQTATRMILGMQRTINFLNETVIISCPLGSNCANETLSQGFAWDQSSGILVSSSSYFAINSTLGYLREGFSVAIASTNFWTTPPPPVFDFSISASPRDDTVLAGGIAQYQVNLTQVTGTPQPVTLSIISGLPSGSSVSFSSNTVTPSALSGLTITTSSNAVGDFNITINAVSGTVNHKTSIMLHLYDFTITSSLCQQTVLRGVGIAPFNLTFTLVKGSSNVNLPPIQVVVSNLPSNTTVVLTTFTPGPTPVQFVTLSPTPEIVQVQLVTHGNTPLGDFAFSITGVDNRTPEGGSRQISSCPSGFQLHTFYPSITVSCSGGLAPSGSGGSVNVTLLPGSSTVNLPSMALQYTGLPSGTTFSPTQSGVPPFTVPCGFTLPAGFVGNVAFQVSGVFASSPGGGGGTVAGSPPGGQPGQPLYLNIYDFRVAIAPEETVLRGGTANYTVTVSLLGGSSTVNLPIIYLNVSGLPSGVVAGFRPANATAGFISYLTLQTTGSTPLGDFSFNVTGADIRPLLGGSRSGTGELHMYDFAIASSPTSRSAMVGETVSYNETLTLLPGSSIIGLPNVQVLVMGLSIGTVTTPNPASVIPSLSGTMMILTVRPLSVGSFNLAVIGNDTRVPEGGSRSSLPLSPQTLSVSKANTSTVTVVFDASTSAPWSGKEMDGASAYDTSNVTGVVGLFPTGTVKYEFYTMGTCSGSFSAQNLTLSGGLVHSSATHGPLAVGNYSFLTVYYGDSNYNGSTSSCEPFKVMRSFDFTVHVTPLDNTVIRGGSTTYKITVILTPGSVNAPASVSLNISGLPPDATTTGFPASIVFGSTVSFTVNAGSTSLGDYDLAVSGQAGGLARSASAGLHIYDFSVSVTPGDTTVLRGTQTTYHITIGVLSGSTSIGLPATLALAVTGAPSDASVSSVNMIPFPSGVSNPSMTSFSISTGSTSLGDYTLVVKGSSSGGSRSSSANLHIYDFTLKSSQGTLFVTASPYLPGNSASFNITTILSPGSTIVGIPKVSLGICCFSFSIDESSSPAVGTPSFVSTVTLTTNPTTRVSDTMVSIIGLDLSSSDGSRVTSVEVVVLPPVMTITSSSRLVADTQAQIVIGADNIDLNCNGFVIRGITTKSASPLPNNGISLNGRKGVLIRNCVVSNFFIGISLTGSSGDTLFSNLVVFNGYGFSFASSTGNNVQYNNAYQNMIDGFMLSSSNGNTLRANVANSNLGTGFDIVSSSGNALLVNSALGNGRYGFSITLSSNNNTFIKNSSCGNGLTDAYQSSSTGNVFVKDQFCSTSGI
jgi:YVTN family beta-propeller protein/parallel beta-helix repeat protein